MRFNISKKTIYISLCIFIFIVIVSIGGIISYYRWTNMHYFGEIIEVKNGGFLIKTDGDSEKLILINKDTYIRKGRKILKERLQTGDYVIIVGSLNRDGFVEAKVIRIVDILPRPPL